LLVTIFYKQTIVLRNKPTTFAMSSVWETIYHRSQYSTRFLTTLTNTESNQTRTTLISFYSCLAD